MKKITYSLLGIFALGGLFASCDPMTEDGPSQSQEVYTAENVDVTATPVVVNGKNTNQIIVENKSKLYSQWGAPELIEDSVKSTLAYDTLYVTQTGAQTIRFMGKNYSCSVLKDLTASVDEIYYLSDALTARLCCSGTPGNYTPTDAKKLAPTSFGSTFEASKVKVVQEITSGGKKGNRLYVYNSNPVLSKWTFGTGTTDKNVGSVYVNVTGTYDLKLSYTKADGTTGTYDAGSYTVEAFSYIPETLTNLCGDDGVKTWCWNDSESLVWGNGGFMEASAPAWWGQSINDIDSQATEKSGNLEADGKNAYFTFDLSSMSVSQSGVTATSPFSIDLDEVVKEGWNSGSVSIKSTKASADIPMGFLVNNNNIRPGKYYIMKCTKKTLTLCAPEPGSGDWGTAWFWCFKVK